LTKIKGKENIFPLTLMQPRFVESSQRILSKMMQLSVLSETESNIWSNHLVHTLTCKRNLNKIKAIYFKPKKMNIKKSQKVTCVSFPSSLSGS